MMRLVVDPSGHLWELLRTDFRRLANRFRYSPYAAALSLAFLLAAAVAWLRWSRASGEGVGTALGLRLGLIVSGTVAFVGYGMLFGGRDAAFLRQVGVETAAIYAERTLRLLSFGLIAALVAALASPTAGGDLTPLSIALACAGGVLASSALVYAYAAQVTARGAGGGLGAGIRTFDPDLARVAPLVYAPLVPFLVGTASAVAASAVAMPALAAILALLVAVAAIPISSGIFARGGARFLAQSGEMSYVPDGGDVASAASPARGFAALLPGRSSIVSARDSLAARRRYPWMLRVNWIAGTASVVALARWGEDPGVRLWVVSVVGATLIGHASAAIGFGRSERRGRRWLDRSLGIRGWERALGRFSWVWATSLWLLVPVALAWGWWSGVSGAWLFPAAGAATGLAGTFTSLVLAESR